MFWSSPTSTYCLPFVVVLQFPHRDSHYSNYGSRPFLLKWKCSDHWLQRPLGKSILISTGSIYLGAQALHQGLTAKFNVKGWACEQGGTANEVKQGETSRERGVGYWERGRCNKCGDMSVRVVLNRKQAPGEVNGWFSIPPIVLILLGPQGALRQGRKLKEMLREVHSCVSTLARHSEREKPLFLDI